MELELPQEAELVEPEDLEVISSDRAAHITGMAMIADLQINGEPTATPSQWAQMAQNNKEEEIRIQLGSAKAQKDVDAMFLTELETPTLTSEDLNLLFEATLEEGFQNPYRNVLEVETAKALSDTSLQDDVRGAVAQEEELNKDDLTSFEKRESLNSALLRLETMKHKHMEELEAAGIPRTIGNYLSLFIPGVDTVQQISLGERDALTLGESFQNDANRLFQSDDPMAVLDEIEARLSDSSLPTLLKLDYLDSLTMDEDEATLRTALEIVDLGGILSSVFRTGKALAKSVNTSRLARVANNPKTVHDRTKDIAERVRSGDDVSEEELSEMVENVMPSTGNDFLNAQSGESARKLDELKAELDAVELTRGQTFLSDAEAQQSLEMIRNDIIDKLPRGITADVKETTLADGSGAVFRITPEDTTGEFSHMFGTGKSGTKGFVSEEAAASGAKRMGFKDGAFNITKQDGVYYVEVQRDLTSFTETGESILKGMETEAIMPWVPEKLLGNKVNINFAPRVAQGGIQGVNASAKLNQIFKDSMKAFTSLSKKSQEDMNAALHWMQTRPYYDGTEEAANGRWLTNREFEEFYQTRLNRAPTEAEKTAYGARILIHQADEYIINNSLRQEFINNGYQEFSVTGIRDNFTMGKIIPGFDRKKTSNVSIVDATTGKLYDKGEGARGALEKLASNDNLVLIKYLSEVPTEFGKAQYVIASKQSFNTKAIRGRVLKHFDGPHREYESPVFLKQAVIENNEFKKMRTHFNVGSEAEAVKLADDYNEAMEAFLLAEKAVNNDTPGAGEMVARASAVISKNTNYASFDEMAEAVGKGQINRTFFEAWADKGTRPLNTPPGGRNSTTIPEDAADVDLDFNNLSETARKYIDQGRMYYSTRGEHLRAPDGSLAAVSSPNEVLENALRHVINTQAFGQFKHRAIREWSETFGQYLEGANFVAPDGTLVKVKRPDWYWFTHGNFTEDTPAKIRTAGERLRVGVNRILHAKSADARRIDRWVYELGQYILDPKTKGAKKLGAKGLVKVLDNSGVDAVRSLVFKTFLGMGDVSQVVVQMAMLPAVMMVSPRFGAQSLAMGLPMRMATMLDDSKAIDNLASTMSRIIGGVTGKKGLKPAEVRMMIDDLKNSGADIISGGQAELDMPFDGNRIYNRKLVQYVNKALDIGLIPFKEGERMNQIIAFQIAWMEHYEKFGRPLGDAMGKVQNRAETLSGNMKSSSRASWQNGLASVPMQFAAHPIRVMEQVLSNADGLTGAEKVRFYTGITLAYGLGGMGLDSAVDSFSDMYTEYTGNEVDAETRNIIRDGMVGAIFENSDIGRIQPLRDGIVKQILTGDIEMSDFFGPAGSLIGDSVSDIGGSILVRGLLEGTLAPSEAATESYELLKDVMLNIPTAARARRAWWMYMYDTEINSSGRVLDQREYSTLDAALAYAGFPPRDSRDVYDRVLELKDMEKNVRDDVMDVMELHRLALTTDSDEDIAYYTSRIARMNSIYSKQEPHIQRMYERTIRSNLERMAENTTENGLRRLMRVLGPDYVFTRFKRSE